MNARQEAVKRAKAYWQRYFDHVGDPDAYYTIKLPYGYGSNERVQCIENEIKDPNKNVYFEWIDSGYDVRTEGGRRLFKYVYNPNWEDDYMLRSKRDNKTGREWFTRDVPLTNFVEIDVNAEMEKEVPAEVQNHIDLVDPEDIPLGEATLKDFAAIVLKAPVSNKKWLNDIVVRA